LSRLRAAARYSSRAARKQAVCENDRNSGQTRRQGNQGSGRVANCTGRLLPIRPIGSHASVLTHRSVGHHRSPFGRGGFRQVCRKRFNTIKQSGASHACHLLVISDRLSWFRGLDAALATKFETIVFAAMGLTCPSARLLFGPSLDRRLNYIGSKR
jgi:hypothetical protein